MIEQNCITQLMPRPPVYRPFLGEGVSPIVAVPQALESLNVLHNPEFLVVSLLDQKTVVLNSGPAFVRRIRFIVTNVLLAVRFALCAGVLPCWLKSLRRAVR